MQRCIELMRTCTTNGAFGGSNYQKNRVCRRFLCTIIGVYWCIYMWASCFYCILCIYIDTTVYAWIAFHPPRYFRMARGELWAWMDDGRWWVVERISWFMDEYIQCVILAKNDEGRYTQTRQTDGAWKIEWQGNYGVTVVSRSAVLFIWWINDFPMKYLYLPFCLWLISI